MIMVCYAWKLKFVLFCSLNNEYNKPYILLPLITTSLKMVIVCLNI